MKARSLAALLLPAMVLVLLGLVALIAPAKPPATGSGDHPAAERQSKRKGALADNLKKWLAARRQDD